MGFSLAVPRFGMVVEVNLSRTFVHRAYDALQAGRLLEAGVLLREAVRRQLVAECRWNDCLPKDFSERTPAVVLLKALRNAKCCSRCGYEITLDIIQACNRAAHCGRVDADEIRGAITIMHKSIDNDPCGEPRERIEHCIPVPEVNDDVDDDDDGANWWKQGGGA